ncbi:MAG: phenylacetic acid degradation bifunctional protein PaaZ, partial [Ginsengibacter sp.]
MKLGNYILGQWVEGDGDGQALYNAVTGELIANATTKGLDFASILDYGRKTGSPALRKMTFQERGRMLKALALHLLSQKEKFYTL